MCAIVSCTKPSFREAWIHNYRGRKRVCSNTLKRKKLKVYISYISLESNKLVCFVNCKGSFQFHDLVHYFWKKCHELYDFLCGAIYFIYFIYSLFIVDYNRICSCYHTVPSAIWEIFSEFLIFCNSYFTSL